MTKNKKTESFKKNPHFIVAMMRPFVDGARLQMERLLSAQQMLKHDPVIAGQRCYHETSNLFEDLATIIQYLNLCDITTQFDQQYKDVRDLIRHDIREEFDRDDKRKQERSSRLGINPKMQLEISFNVGDIKIGQNVIKLVNISNFINITEQIMNALLLDVKVASEEPKK